jgi:ABC-type Fe3+/spermidine/putrescine transport system ATPase subunit
LYRTPNSAFVAEFISGANLLPGSVVEHQGGELVVKTALGNLRVCAERAPTQREITLSVRPDQIHIGRGSEAEAVNTLAARLDESGFLGESSEHALTIVETPVRMTHSPPLFELDAELSVHIFAADLIVHTQ